MSGGDAATAVAIDSAGNAYITGWTQSADFPVTAGAFQSTNKALGNGTSSAFVTKLNASGNTLVYSTYLGGTVVNPCFSYEFDPGQAGLSIAIDGKGSAYVAGSTFAPDFPVTPNAFQTTYPAQTRGANSGFVTKLSPDGSSLVYSTYLGGSGSGALCYVQGDQVSGIALDSLENAYLSGTAASSDFPVTGGVLQPTSKGNTNAFVTELNPQGSAEILSTYLGGSGADEASGIALGVDGSIFVSGSTSSSDFPVTSGVFQPTFPPSYGFVSGFVTKLKPDASALEYSTFLGGPLTTLNGLAVDSAGSAYVTGSTGDAPFFSTPDAPMQLPEPGFNELWDVFVAKLDPSASGLDFATMLGSSTGANFSGGNALALDLAGNLYVTGYAGGNDFPITAGAFQTTNRYTGHGYGEGTVFVSKLALAGDTTGHTPTSITVTVSSGSVNQGQPITFTAAVTGEAGTATPTGLVTFGVGTGTNSYSVALNASGVATWTSTTLAPGNYYASAVYRGDSSHLSSYASSAATFRIVGVPAIFTGLDEGGPDPTYTYGTSFAGIYAFVQDSAGNGLGGVQVNFSGSGLTFICSCISGADGFVYATPIAHTLGNLTATASVSGVSTTLSFPMTVVPAPLTVGMESNSRQYGRANPIFAYVVGGLANGDTVTVTPSTTATSTSPVGAYPITATVSGLATANYNVTVRNGILEITQALSRSGPHPQLRAQPMVLPSCSLPASLSAVSSTEIHRPHLSRALPLRPPQQPAPRPLANIPSINPSEPLPHTITPSSSGVAATTSSPSRSLSKPPVSPSRWASQFPHSPIRSPASSTEMRKPRP